MADPDASDEKQDERDTEPDRFAIVQFLWERAHEEAKLYYTRLAVFLALETLTVGAAGSLIVNLELPRVFKWSLVLAVALGGVVITLTALAVCFRSQAYNWSYLTNARRVVGEDPHQASMLRESLGNPDRHSLWPLPASTWTQLLLGFFLLTWIGVGLVSAAKVLLAVATGH